LETWAILVLVLDFVHVWIRDGPRMDVGDRSNKELGRRKEMRR
jgi:hypothetical protein